MKDSNCPCIQSPGAAEAKVAKLKDTGRGTAVTHTYGANINADVIKETSQGCTFKDSQMRSVNNG